LFSLDYGASLTLMGRSLGPVANEVIPDLTDVLPGYETGRRDSNDNGR
jgi:hypothetical protein